jgi:Flp pilus assembly protein TadD
VSARATIGLRTAARNAEVWKTKGYHLARGGRIEEALQCFNRAIEWRPSCAKALKNRSRCLDELGLRIEAAEPYRQFLSLAEGDPEWAGKLQWVRGRLDELEAMES